MGNLAERTSSPSAPVRSSQWIADASLTISAVMWGINIPVVKHATSLVDPFAFNAVRMVFSALMLGVLASLEYRWKKPKWGQVYWPRAFAFAACSGLFYSLLFMLGISRTTSANAALLMASMPMWTALISRYFLRERLPKITWWGLGITFLGTAIVTGAHGGINFAIAFLMGNILILAAALTWASATVISRPLMESIGPLQLAFLSSAITLPIHLAIASPYFPGSWSQWNQGSLIPCILYSGALSTGLAYATWNFGVQRLGGSHASVYQNVVTLVAVLGSWIALKEQPLWTQWVGGALIVIGLLVMRKGR